MIKTKIETHFERHLFSENMPKPEICRFDTLHGNSLLGHKNMKKYVKNGFLWLKLICKTFLFPKFFNFTSKKVVPEAFLGCFCAS